MNRRFYSALGACLALALLICCPISASATVTLSPASYNFGSTAPNTGTAWETFTLANSASSAVSITSVTVSGPFVVSSNCGSSVAANSSCPIYVYFYPTASGSFTGTLTVVDAAGTQTSALSGTGSGGASCTTAPGAFTLSDSNITSSGVSLSWTTPSEGTNCTLSGYTVHIGSSTYAVAAGTTSYTATGLTASTAYSIYVTATNNDTTTNSNTLSVTTLAAPSCTTAPGSFTLSDSNITSSGVSLSWTVPSEGTNCTLSGYTVHVGSNSYSVAAGTTTYTATGLTASTAYSIYVTATNNDTTTNSNTVSITTLAAPSCTTAPGAFTLSDSNITSSGVSLSWTTPSEGTNCTLSGYTVHIGSSSYAVAAGTTTYTATGLTASTAYSIYVTATNNDTTTNSNTVSITTLAPPTCSTAPGSFTLSDSSITSSGFALSWTTPTEGTNCTLSGYTVHIGSSTYSVAAGTTTYTATGLSASTAYSVYVAAANSDTSTSSNTLSITTAASGGGSCYPTWSATATYQTGNQVSLNGQNYTADYYSVNTNPSTNNGVVGTGEPWIPDGPCSSCSVVPPVPTGLNATSITDAGAILGWTAVTPPTACTVSYSVQVTGQSAQTTSATTETVSGLNSSTTYTYTVAATDSVGSSATASGSFTTSANPCTTVPTAAPTGLTSANTTGASTVLSWSAVTPPANCTISYVITGGPSTVDASTTTGVVSGLSPSTTYTFSVAATDYAGTGPASTISVTTTTEPANGYFVGGWFEEWGVYYAGSNVADLQNSGVVNSLTHVIYAFAAPSQDGSSCVLEDSYADTEKAVPLLTGAPTPPQDLQGNIGALWQLKQLHPNLKILISIGGWHPASAETSTFPYSFNLAFKAASATAASQQAFVTSCMNLFIDGNFPTNDGTATVPGIFDGFDIDWEFPNASETAGFTALLQEFRTQLTAQTAVTGKNYQLLADLSAGLSTPGAAADSGDDGGYDTINISALAGILDYMNVDGYNYAGDWAATSNDASPLFDESADPFYHAGQTDAQIAVGTGGCNFIDCTVQYYLAHGAPAAKYTMGFPLYGAGWAGGLTSANGGMYQTGTAPDNYSGTPTGLSLVPLANGTGVCPSDNNQSSPDAGCDPLLVDGLATYGTIVNMQANGFTASFDSTRCATRMYSASAPFVDYAYSYDDANSVACKVAYIKQYGLGGGYVWALKDDTSTGALTKTISTDLNQ